MKKVLAAAMTMILAAGMTVSAFASEDLADKKIALLLPGSIDDQGWNATNNAGALAAEEELGVAIDVVESVPAEEYESTFTEYAEKGYDLIMAAGSQWDESATVVAENYPDTIFCAINGQISDFPNQIPVFPKEYEGSYLVFFNDAATTENGQFAVTGGQSNDPMVKLMDTYEAMAIKIATERGIEGASANRAFVDSWTDVSATKDLIASMIDQGADSVFCYSNEGTSGAIQAAEEKGVTFVGFSADKNGESDCVVGSVSMNWAAVYPTIVENILSGNWTGRTDIGVAEGVFEVIPTDKMSEECVAAVDAAIEQIKAGEVDFEQYFGGAAETEAE